jgi:guanine deaminase
MTSYGRQMPQLHRGHIFHVSGAPHLSESVGALVEYPDGGLLIDDDGVIRWCGPWPDRPESALAASVRDHQGAFLLPGFVDTHLHFPQIHCTDAHGGGQLLEWLDRVVFPAEARFADAAFAARAAESFCDRLIAAGTTTSLVFGSQFPGAQRSLFEAAGRAGLRMVLGRTTMTIGPASAAPLLTSEDAAIGLVRDEIEQWHGDKPRHGALAQVAIVPRFALSVTPVTLSRLGELYEEYRDRGVYFTSHLSENNRPADGEVSRVLSSYSVDRSLDVFDGHFLPGSRAGGPSFLGRRTVFAHAVHCNDDELARLAESGTSIAHCPVSQQFLGSGTMPWRRTSRSGATVAIGSDIGAGDEWFVPRILNACFKAHHGEAGDAAIALHPAELLYTGTLAGAQALDLDARIGNFDIGKEADFVVIDPDMSGELGELLRQRQPRIDPGEERDAILFTVLMAARLPGMAEAYVLGRQLSPIGAVGDR